MKKILLINPPVIKHLATTLPDFATEEQGFFPPLGLIYLATFVKEKMPDIEVKVLDSYALKMSYDDIKNYIRKFKPDMVGVPAWTFSYLDTVMLTKITKEVNPNIKVCTGGPHVTIYPEETLSQPAIDYIITGEAEYAFTDLIDKLKDNKDLSRVPNLGYKENGKIKINPVQEVINELDKLPFPDRKMTCYEKYYSILDKTRPITTMITSRGCPFQCFFCYQKNTGWRSRSAENIADEIEECVKMGIKNIFIFDETFTVNKKRVLKICDEIIKRKIKIEWDIRSRVDTIDEEMLIALKKAGCKRISYGIESGNTRILNVLKKEINLEKAEKIAKLTKKHGFTVLLDFMIGSPEETKKEIEESMALALKMDPHFVQFSVTTCLPATELYDLAIKQGVVKSDVWKEFALNPTESFKPPLWNIFSEDQISQILNNCYKRFYVRPKYILKKLLGIRSFWELKVNAKAALKMLSGKKKNGKHKEAVRN
ncbi:MAG: radical SAM protein [Armatimonadota bacterium]